MNYSRWVHGTRREQETAIQCTKKFTFQYSERNNAMNTDIIKAKLEMLEELRAEAREEGNVDMLLLLKRREEKLTAQLNVNERKGETCGKCHEFVSEGQVIHHWKYCNG